MDWFCKGQIKKLELQQSREALVMGPIQKATLACKIKRETFQGYTLKGLPNGLHLLPPAWAPAQTRSPEASCCLVSLPQWLPLLLTLFPLCCQGDAAQGARSLLLSAATEGAWSFRRRGSGHQQLSLLTKQTSSLASVWTSP